MSTLTRPSAHPRAAQRVVITAGLLGLTVALSVAALFGAAANPPCATPTPTTTRRRNRGWGGNVRRAATAAGRACL